MSLVEVSRPDRCLRHRSRRSLSQHPKRPPEPDDALEHPRREARGIEHSPLQRPCRYAERPGDRLDSRWIRGVDGPDRGPDLLRRLASNEAGEDLSQCSGAIAWIGRAGGGVEERPGQHRREVGQRLDPIRQLGEREVEDRVGGGGSEPDPDDVGWSLWSKSDRRRELTGYQRLILPTRDIVLVDQRERLGEVEHDLEPPVGHDRLRDADLEVAPQEPEAADDRVQRGWGCDLDVVHAANVERGAPRRQRPLARRLPSATDWPRILGAYNALLALTGSPVVAVNRVVAVREVHGAGRALGDLDAIPRSADPWARVAGEWRGEGTFLGGAATATLRWEPVLSGQFHRVTQRIAVRRGESEMVFEGHGYYVAATADGTSGTWFDIEGHTYALDVRLLDDAIDSRWGPAGASPVGHTVYRVSGAGLVVVDSMRTADGGWREFGRINYGQR